MSARGVALLALVAAVALAGVILSREPQQRALGDDAIGEPFLPGLAERLEGIDAVRAVRGGGELVARVARGRDGWVTTNRWGYPADAATVRRVLDDLVAARGVEPKARDRAGHARLGVAPIDAAARRTLALTLEGVGEDLTVILGERAAGDAAGRYVRRHDADRAWHVEPAVARPDRVADWLDERLVDIPAKAVQRVDIDTVDGEPVRVRRRAGGLAVERPRGRSPLSETTPRSLARVVTDLRLTDVQRAADAPAWPRLATARFETKKGLIIRLRAYTPRRASPRHAVRLHAHTRADAAQGVGERAARLNERWRGWSYTVPDYKFTNATRTLEAVLE